jgi:hypothetical protein
MTRAGVTPDEVTWNTLLNLAPDYPEGRRVLTEMTRAGVTPDEVTSISLAKLVRSIDQADELVPMAINLRIAGPGFFTSVIARVYTLMSADDLLGWAYRQDLGPGVSFPAAAFAPAILGYRKSRRFEDALRLIVNYPHLPASQKYLESVGRAADAERYFLARFRNGSDPHNASFALAKLFQYQKDPGRMREWAAIALGLPGHHKKRLENLRAMITAPMA